MAEEAHDRMGSRGTPVEGDIESHFAFPENSEGAKLLREKEQQLGRLLDDLEERERAAEAAIAGGLYVG